MVMMIVITMLMMSMNAMFMTVTASTLTVYWWYISVESSLNCLSRICHFVCLTLWRHGIQKTAKKVVMVVGCYIRALLGDNSKPNEFPWSSWVSDQVCRVWNVVMHVFKVKKSLAPTYISSWSLACTPMGYASAIQITLFLAIVLWNSLPAELKSIESPGTFILEENWFYLFSLTVFTSLDFTDSYYQPTIFYYSLL